MPPTNTKKCYLFSRLKALRKGRALEWSPTWPTVHLRSRIQWDLLAHVKLKYSERNITKHKMNVIFLVFLYIFSVTAHPGEVGIGGCNSRWLSYSSELFRYRFSPLSNNIMKALDLVQIEHVIVCGRVASKSLLRKLKSTLKSSY